MEKIDKEALTQQLSYEGKTITEINGFKNGIEYAENHYLKLIWEKDDIISQRNQVLGYRNDDVNRLKSELQQAKAELTITNLALENKKKTSHQTEQILEAIEKKLQQAKELLKELKQNLIYIDKESMNVGCEEEIKKIEEFLK